MNYSELTGKDFYEAAATGTETPHYHLIGKVLECNPFEIKHWYFDEIVDEMNEMNKDLAPIIYYDKQGVEVQPKKYNSKGLDKDKKPMPRIRSAVITFDDGREITARALTGEQAETLAEIADEDNAAIRQLMEHTGLEMDDLLSLKWYNFGALLEAQGNFTAQTSRIN